MTLHPVPLLLSSQRETLFSSPGAVGKKISSEDWHRTCWRQPGCTFQIKAERPGLGKWNCFCLLWEPQALSLLELNPSVHRFTLAAPRWATALPEPLALECYPLTINQMLVTSRGTQGARVTVPTWTGQGRARLWVNSPLAVWNKNLPAS